MLFHIHRPQRAVQPCALVMQLGAEALHSTQQRQQKQIVKLLICERRAGGILIPLMRSVLSTATAL